MIHSGCRARTLERGVCPSLLPYEDQDFSDPAPCRYSDDSLDFLEAIDLIEDDILSLKDDRVQDRIAKPILQRAQTHLASRLQKYLIPSPSIDTEAYARQVITSTAAELKHASEHLDRMAQWFQVNGYANHAATAGKAARRALKATEGLVD